MDLQTELHQRLSEIGAHVALAAAAARAAHDAPQALRSCIERLAEQAEESKQVYMSTDRESVLAGYLAALEATAQRARELCRNQPHRHDLPAATLDEAWQEIRDLRHQVDHRRRDSSETAR